MNFIKNVFKLFLSLLLAAGLLGTCLSFAGNRILQENELGSVINDSEVGKQIMNYEYLPEDVEEKDFYSSLYDAIPVQISLVTNISMEDAELCHREAFEQVREKHNELAAQYSSEQLAKDLGEAYTKAAVDHGIIRHGDLVYFNGSNQEIEFLLRKTMIRKYEAALDELKDNGSFCALTVDQKYPFAYVLQTGKEAAETQNGLYRFVEDRIDEIYRTGLLKFLSRLKGNDAEAEELSYEQFEQDMRTGIYDYLHSQNISTDQIEDKWCNKTLNSSIKNTIYPEFESCLPTYERTIGSLAPFLQKGLGMLLNNVSTYILAGVSALLLILLFLVGKKGSLPFLGIVLLLSGGILFVIRFFSEKPADLLTQAVASSGNKISILIPAFVRYFAQIVSGLGIWLAGAGFIFFLLSLLFGRSRKEV